jgi:hypothetical protein
MAIGGLVVRNDVRSFSDATLTKKRVKKKVKERVREKVKKKGKDIFSLWP